MMKQDKLLILYGKSGSGKSTIEKILCQQHGFEKCISHTTRPMREGEHEGVDYFFTTKEFFTKNARDFVEKVEYDGNLYGLHKSQLGGKKIVVMEPQGVLQVLNNIYMEPIPVYLYTDEDELMTRMIKRGDSNESIINRLLYDRKAFENAEALAKACVNNVEPDETAEAVSKLY